MTIDTGYMMDKSKDQEAARAERIRKSLVEFVDQLCRDFELSITTHDEIIDIIERFVTKKRHWL